MKHKLNKRWANVVQSERWLLIYKSGFYRRMEITYHSTQQVDTSLAVLHLNTQYWFIYIAARMLQVLLCALPSSVKWFLTHDATSGFYYCPVEGWSKKTWSYARRLRSKLGLRCPRDVHASTKKKKNQLMHFDVNECLLRARVFWKKFRVNSREYASIQIQAASGDSLSRRAVDFSSPPQFDLSVIRRQEYTLWRCVVVWRRCSRRIPYKYMRHAAPRRPSALLRWRTAAPHTLRRALNSFRFVSAAHETKERVVVVSGGCCDDANDVATDRPSLWGRPRVASDLFDPPVRPTIAACERVFVKCGAMHGSTVRHTSSDFSPSRVAPPTSRTGEIQPTDCVSVVKEKFFQRPARIAIVAVD